MVDNAVQALTDLRSGEFTTQKRVLRSIRASDRNASLQQLAMSCDGDVLRAVVAFLQVESPRCEARDLAEDAWFALAPLITALPKQHELAARVVHEFGLLECLERVTRQRGSSNNPFFSAAISSILALKRHDIALFRDGSTLAHDLAAALCRGEKTNRPALLLALHTLALEHRQWNAAIVQELRDTQPQWPKGQVVAITALVLELVDSRAVRALDRVASDDDAHTSSLLSSDASRLLDGSGDIAVFADTIVYALRSDASFVKCMMLTQLRFDGQQEFADAFVAHGGLTALVAIVAADDDPATRVQASTCLCELATFSDAHRRSIVALQVEHEHCELLPTSFYMDKLKHWGKLIDVAACKQQLASRDAVVIRQCLTTLPKNIEILAALCIHDGLARLLLTILRADDTTDDICTDIWTLLLHIVLELPRLGIAQLVERYDLATLALRFVSRPYTTALRKLAAMFLTAPLNKAQSIRMKLVNDVGAIPLLAGLLAQESDSDVADVLSDLLRDIVASDPSYVDEMTLVVRGLLDREGDLPLGGASENGVAATSSELKCYYLNLLSLYRRTSSSSSTTLGIDAVDDVASFEVLVDVLANGSDLEKRIALTQLRRYAPSWGPIHLAVIRNNIHALACVVIHEADELKALATDVLRIAARLDTGCRTNVLAAQAQFWPDNPIFTLDELCANDDDDDAVETATMAATQDGGGSDSDSCEYVYSDDESGRGEVDEDTSDDAVGESIPKRQKL